MEQMSHPELASAVRQYFRRNGNKPMSSAEVHEDQFKDQDKVRFQLVFSNMALKPPHEMIKLQEGGGTKGVRWRLREPSDPPFVEPVKVPRAKRTVEIDRPLASTSSSHASRTSHRSIGMVVETPPEVRAREVNETIPVEHRALKPPPPNNALASALARAAKNFTPPKASVPVASFKDQKQLDYEIAPDAKLTSIPRGASGLNPIHGAVEIPRHKVEAKSNDASTASTGQQQASTGAVRTSPDGLSISAKLSEAVRKIKQDNTVPPIVMPDNVVNWPLPQSTVPNGTLPEQTPGQLLDLFLAAMKPMFQSMITDAIKDALHHAPVQISSSHTPQEVVDAAVQRPSPAPDVQASGPAPISVPVYEEPAPRAPKHKAIMPQDADAVVKTRLPKVVVIGLPKPQWEFDVKERFAKWLDIRTVHADARGKTARDWCKGAEHVILMSDYNSHALEHSLKSPPAIEYERLPGGPGKLDDRLRQIIQSYTKVA